MAPDNPRKLSDLGEGENEGVTAPNADEAVPPHIKGAMSGSISDLTTALVEFIQGCDVQGCHL